MSNVQGTLKARYAFIEYSFTDLRNSELHGPSAPDGATRLASVFHRAHIAACVERAMVRSLAPHGVLE